MESLKEKKRVYARAYRARNRDKVRMQDNLRNKKLKDEVYKHYGSECVCCGEKEPAFLTLDHFTKDLGMRLIWKGFKLFHVRGHREYARLKRLGWPPVVRVLCMNCNFARRHNKTCPHENGRKI